MDRERGAETAAQGRESYLRSTRMAGGRNFETLRGRKMLVKQCHNIYNPHELLVGGLEHQFYFPIYWVANHPN